MTTGVPIPITEDRGIWKWQLESGDPCKLAPEFTKGSRVRLHYVIHTIPFENSSIQADDPFKGGLALVRLLDHDNGGNEDEDEDRSMNGIRNKQGDNEVFSLA
jgi:hypothetical protein